MSSVNLIDRGRGLIPWRACAWLLAALIAWLLSACAAELLHARISPGSGGTLIKGVEDDDWSYASINTILLPCDALWIDKEGTLEREMAGGLFLRQADRSKAEILQLPPSAAAYHGSPYRVRRVWVKAFVNALERERMAYAVAMDFRAVAHYDAPPLSGKPNRLSVDEFKKSSTSKCFL